MKNIYVLGAALIEDGKLLVTKRNSDRILGDLWEFPGGKIEQGELPQESLKRELKEEFNDEIIVGDKVTETASYEYEFGTVHLTVYYAKFLSKNFDLIAHSKVKWIDPAEALDLNWAPADIPAAQAISKVNLREVRFDEDH